MTWDKAKAKAEIRKFFINHQISAKKAVSSSTDGKVYELYCLVQTLDWLKSHYPVTVRFKGKTVDFKASPGSIDRSRSYFEIMGRGSMLELHTDIEIETLGSKLLGGSSDNSGYHEIDLVLINSSVPNKTMPRHDQLFLGVECKSSANFGKGIVKQVLGVRRELSFYRTSRWTLDKIWGTSHRRMLGADPASLYWLAFADPKGLSYAQSPGKFGIHFKHWSP
ncbi:hypothetical protein [Paracoccus actinidiae]|uniref:hypothetical protein n=1 Tax=Paracoccus actinidiae TaxID=3064531 RepID=UPI0027D21359|nr:hypothetical protein [Paracoccus sp. M09]